ncbi:MAG: hypothetical protein AB9834_15015 [Lentimicrobium sp.]
MKIKRSPQVKPTAIVYLILRNRFVEGLYAYTPVYSGNQNYLL